MVVIPCLHGLITNYHNCKSTFHTFYMLVILNHRFHYIWANSSYIENFGVDGIINICASKRYVRTIPRIYSQLFICAFLSYWTRQYIMLAGCWKTYKLFIWTSWPHNQAATAIKKVKQKKNKTINQYQFAAYSTFPIMQVHTGLAVK